MESSWRGYANRHRAAFRRRFYGRTRASRRRCGRRRRRRDIFFPKHSLCPHAVPPFARYRAETAALYAYVKCVYLQDLSGIVLRARDDGPFFRMGREITSRGPPNACSRTRACGLRGWTLATHECGVKRNAT
jgi:hypothetical protein